MSDASKTQKGSSKPTVVIPLERTTAAAEVELRGVIAWATTHWIVASAGLTIGLSTLISALFLAFLSDRYSVEVKFAVRGQETPAFDALGLIGLGNSNLSSDSYILVDYVQGRGMFETVSKSVDLTKIYSAPTIDFFSRLGGQPTIDEKVKFWRKMVSASYEPATGIISVEVSAFDRRDALDTANAVTDAAESLINRLSTESRRDALKAATAEVERAEQRQRLLRTAVQRFREKEQVSDPVQRAGGQQGMIEKIRGELSRIDTELQTIRGFMKDDAPSVVVLKTQREALLKQMAALQEEIGRKTTAKEVGSAGEGKTLASMLSSFEEIEAERTFAEKQYLTALASLERARLEADRKQRFLAIFEKAALPDEPARPRRLWGIFSTFVGATLVWALGLFVVLGIREHS